MLKLFCFDIIAELSLLELHEEDPCHYVKQLFDKRQTEVTKKGKPNLG